MYAISCSTGNYFNGHNINMGHKWVLNLVGPTGTILLDITRLTNLTGGNCALNNMPPPGSCDFIGTVTASWTSIPGGTFRDTISGMLTRGPNASGTTTPAPWVLATLDGALAPNHLVLPGSTLDVVDVQFCRSTQVGQGCGSPGDLGRLREGHGAATLSVKTVIPEPGTLGLLGTGLFGLAGLVRRKRNLGT